MPPEATSLDIDALRPRLAGDAVVPGNPGLGHRADGLEPRRRPAPGRRRAPRPAADDVAAIVTSPASTACGSRPRGPATAPRRSAARRRDPAQAPSACAASRSTPRRRRARVPAGALWADVTAPAVRARPRRRCRLLAPTSASSATRSAAASAGSARARPRRQQRARVRGRHRRRPPRRVDADNDARAVLGAARRRRQLRHRHRARVQALPAAASSTAAPLLWPLERAPEVLHAWREWTATVPDERLGLAPSSCASRPFPTFPSPSATRGSSFVGADGLADEQAAARSGPAPCATWRRPTWTPCRRSPPARCR